MCATPASHSSCTTEAYYAKTRGDNNEAQAPLHCPFQKYCAHDTDRHRASVASQFA